MAKLYYRLEFLKNEGEPSNEGVYLQLRQSPKAADWFDRTRKQDYEGGTSVLGDALFSIAGITELSVQPFRIWFSKSPVYSWQELIGSVIGITANNLSLTGGEALMGSPINLENVIDRLEP